MTKNEDNLIKHEKKYTYKGTGIVRLDAIIEGHPLKGFNLFLNHRHIFSMVRANEPWTDENDRIYYMRRVKNKLYIRHMVFAIYTKKSPNETL